MELGQGGGGGEGSGNNGPDFIKNWMWKDAERDQSRMTLVSRFDK